MTLQSKECGRGESCLNPLKDKYLDGLLPIQEFYEDKYKSSGYRSECKSCCNQPPVFSKKYKSGRNLKIIEEYKNGVTTDTISKKYDVSLSTIYKTLRDNEIPKIDRLDDLTGKKFGRLDVIQKEGSFKGIRYWLCRCTCGSEKLVSVSTAHLYDGHTQSCGCLNRERFIKTITKHGQGKAGEETPEYIMWRESRTRAGEYNEENNLEISHIVIPEYCPVLGIKLQKNIGKMGDNSPTLDRINNKKGYIKSNIAVISLKANAMKRNGTLEDIEKLYLWMKTNKEKGLL